MAEGTKPNSAGDQHGRKLALRIVVVQHGVVVGLARKADLVFGAGQFFAEFAYGLVGLEFGIGLGHREEAAQAAFERLLGRGQRGHGLALAGRLRTASLALRAWLRARSRLPACSLMLQVFFGGLHQVGDQVVAALELHVDLAEGVGNDVFQPDQPVVGADGPENQQANTR
jgi:hypothetical protein